MQFNSIDFMIFFPIVLAVYFVIPRKARTYWLLVASYYFYMNWNPVYAVLIFGSTVVTYLSAIILSALSEQRGSEKKLIMIVCIVLNLGVLGLFKYGNFIIDSINAVTSAAGIVLIKHRFDLLLPVGISFYTFQALGYIIDVYRGDVEVEKNFPKYALFVSFFPQLVAGPIERSKNLLSQMRNIENINLWNARRITSGAILMVWGLFMKMVIADRCSILVDACFDNYRMLGSVELIFTICLFGIQIYCDFASYSMIAIGTARILGFNLMENFAAPYFAKSIKEYWKRWHISLSSWFRDYLYIPLGGNRKGEIKKYINVLIVFLVSGLWHGASWTFVLWGLLHGMYQVIGEVSKPLSERVITAFKVNTDCFSWRLFQTVRTYLLCMFAFILFRADTISQALDYIKRIFTKQSAWVLFNDGLYTLGLDRMEMNILVVAVVVLFIVDYLRYKNGTMIDECLLSQNILFEWLVMISFIVGIFIFGEYGAAFDAKQFIYFQF